MYVVNVVIQTLSLRPDRRQSTACALTSQEQRACPFFPRSLACFLPLQSSAAVQELGTQFSEAFSKVWMSTVPPEISQGEAEASVLRTLTGAGACCVLQNGSEEVLWGPLSVLLTPTLKTHSFPFTFPTEEVEFAGQEAACTPCHLPSPGGSGCWTLTRPHQWSAGSCASSRAGTPPGQPAAVPGPS